MLMTSAASVVIRDNSWLSICFSCSRSSILPRAALAVVAHQAVTLDYFIRFKLIDANLHGLNTISTIGSVTSIGFASASSPDGILTSENPVSLLTSNVPEPSASNTLMQNSVFVGPAPQRYVNHVADVNGVCAGH